MTTAVDGSSPQGRTAVVELLEKLQEPVRYLQELFQPISSRVSQVCGFRSTEIVETAASECMRLSSIQMRAATAAAGCGVPHAEEANGAATALPPYTPLHHWHVLQILELAVNGVMDHIASTKVLECSPIFDVSRMGSTQLGITGLSLPRTFR